ncbi:phage head closure protein [Pseudorhodoferax sp. Leaf274]|uniref:phage head closure protein n=1 Tax=Pseudorhodoferax sp. Leaf274 TaxID=1736318 RepID=UPI0009E91838|nr:phage head closure protein [Pseudorhodoferax sp. Leaf274]
MDSGSLNKRIQIEKRGPAVDDWGQPAPESWVPHIKLWANIQHLNGVQTIKADAPTSVLRASIRIRYRTDIDADMRVVFKGKVYDIKAAVPDEVKREHVDLVCEVLP